MLTDTTVLNSVPKLQYVKMKVRLQFLDRSGTYIIPIGCLIQKEINNK